MFKILIIAGLVILCYIPMSAQRPIDKLIDTEHAFALAAADNGTRAAFLNYAAKDGMIFSPDRANAIEVWTARQPSPSLLSWAPNYADISSNAILGYTTGNWEYRKNGKEDAPGAFGDFITLWLRQSDGNYKFVLDIGVGHEKPAKYSTDWTTSPAKTAASETKSVPTRDAATEFYKLVASKGLSGAYESFAADDIRAYREDKLPFLGKKAAVGEAKSDKAKLEFGKRSSTFTAEDLSYNLNTYTRTKDGKIVEKGNFLQIWKFSNGKWRIVLDVFAPVPDK